MLAIKMRIKQKFKDKLVSKEKHPFFIKTKVKISKIVEIKRMLPNTQKLNRNAINLNRQDNRQD